MDDDCHCWLTPVPQSMLFLQLTVMMISLTCGHATLHYQMTTASGACVKPSHTIQSAL